LADSKENRASALSQDPISNVSNDAT